MKAKRKRPNKIQGFRDFYSALLGNLASFIVYPPILTAYLHKWRGVKIKNPRAVYFSFNVCLDSVYPSMIEIGEDVWLTRNVTILAHFNPSKKLTEYLQEEIVVKPVKIEDGVFIGVGSIILPGVTIGTCSIVGAGSVITKDVEPFSVVAGNPAQLIKKLK